MTPSKSACCDKCLDAGKLSTFEHYEKCSNAACKCHEELCHSPSQPHKGLLESLPRPLKLLNTRELTDLYNGPSQPEKRVELTTRYEIVHEVMFAAPVDVSQPVESEGWGKELYDLCSKYAVPHIAPRYFKELKTFIRSEIQKAQAEGIEEGKREVLDNIGEHLKILMD